MSAPDAAYLDRRVRVLPGQLERARKRVSHLEREAERLGMRWIVEDVK